MVAPKRPKARPPKAYLEEIERKAMGLLKKRPILKDTRQEIDLLAHRSKRLIAERRAELGDDVKFLQSWIANPLRVGAVMPSGKPLAQAMAREVDLGVEGPVVELGPGTGPVTEALIAHGVAPERLVLVEFNPSFCERLRHRFPLATVVQGDAYALARTLAGVISKPVAAVVSSLPLTTRPDRDCIHLALDAFALMATGAPFVQFTYGVTSPVPRRITGMKAHASPRIWRNVPPARVWTYRKG
jgi:phosphatidylethanolamine/phosphatidyl-N-methylethanolamine N-methyltransferase